MLDSVVNMIQEQLKDKNLSFVMNSIKFYEKFVLLSVSRFYSKMVFRVIIQWNSRILSVSPSIIEQAYFPFFSEIIFR